MYQKVTKTRSRLPEERTSRLGLERMQEFESGKVNLGMKDPLHLGQKGMEQWQELALAHRPSSRKYLLCKSRR